MVTMDENYLVSRYASRSEEHVSYPLALFLPSEGYVPTQAHSGGRHIDSEAFKGLRDIEK